MPKKNNVVTCINHDDHVSKNLVKSETSMYFNSEAWHALTVVQPSHNILPPNFVPSSGLPVKLYVCPICGYVESYAGVVIQPELWKVK